MKQKMFFEFYGAAITEFTKTFLRWLVREATTFNTEGKDSASELSHRRSFMLEIGSIVVYGSTLKSCLKVMYVRSFGKDDIFPQFISLNFNNFIFTSICKKVVEGTHI
jgi:hypothetical protein